MTSPDLVSRITSYLSLGGLWNPELAEHNAVRELLIECREALSRTEVELVATMREEATREALRRLAEVFGKRRVKAAADCDREAHKIAYECEQAVFAIAPPATPQPAGEVGNLVTLLISVGRDGSLASDVQTHDNSYADVAVGFAAIKKEIDRVFLDRKLCPYYPATTEDARRKIPRSADEGSVKAEQPSLRISLPDGWALDHVCQHYRVGAGRAHLTGGWTVKLATDGGGAIRKVQGEGETFAEAMQRAVALADGKPA